MSPARSKQERWSQRVLGATLAVAGCAGAPGNRQSTTSFGTISSTSATTAATDDASSSGDSGTASDTTSTSADTSGSDPAESTGEPGPTVTARGTVIDFGTLNMPTVDGATISVFGDASSTTTDADGAFELAIPAGAVAFVEVAEPGYWGAIVRADGAAGDVDLGEINIANDAFIQTRVAAFDNFDSTKAALIARSTAIDTTLNLLQDGQPATAADEYFSIDAQVNFMLGDNVTRSAGFPAIVFFNLDDKGGGVLTMTAMHSTLACTVAVPTPPTQAATITWIEIAC